MKLDWTTDSSGVMLGFSYHDSSLVGLEWVQTSYLRIRLLTPNGINTVELCDLDTVSLQQVWNGAIISEIFAWPITAVPDAVWDMSDGAWHVLLSGRTKGSDERLTATQIMKRNPSAFLVQIMTSYGGTIAAVCEKINVSTEAPTG
jgi:hypothetical protein